MARPQVYSRSLSEQMPSGHEVNSAPLAAMPGQIPSTPLPQGWIEMQDPSGSGKPLYCNPSTGQTSWARPVARTLPPGWIRSQTPDGKPIFIHLETQRCTFQWPGPDPYPQNQAVQAPQLSSSAAQQKPPAPSKPTIARSQTIPAQSRPTAPLMTVNNDSEMARKAVPGIEEAYAVHQLSERNSTRALSRKFTSDLAQTTSAMKDVTISGAGLATRQAKVVGQTLISRKKLGEASRKMVVHTGALGVKTGRAMKGMMSEMVDAADKRGKYQQKQRQFVPPDGEVQPQVPGLVHSYEYQQQQMIDMANNQGALLPQNSQPPHAHIPIPSGVPARKPVKPQAVAVNNLTVSYTSNNTQGSNVANSTGQLAVQLAPGASVPFTAPAVSAPNGSAAPHLQTAGTCIPQPNTTTPAEPPSISQSSSSTQQDQNVTVQEFTAATLEASSTQQDLAHVTTNGSAPAIVGQTVIAGNGQQVQPQKASQPTSRPSQPQASPSISIQAQGSLTINAAGDPPSYAQATRPSATSPVANRPPPRRPLPQATNPPAQRPTSMQNTSASPSQYTTTTPVDQPALCQPQPSQPYMTGAAEPVSYQNQSVNSYNLDQSTYPPTQPLANQGQTTIVEQNQIIVQQQTDAQNTMVAQAQLAMVQQSMTDQIILQQQAETQNMMLAQTQMAMTQQTPADQTVYVNQSQYDVTYIEENATVYDGSTEMVTFVDASTYGDGYVIDGATGEELVYAEQDPSTGEYYEVEYQVDAAGGAYEGEVVEQDCEVCF